MSESTRSSLSAQDVGKLMAHREREGLPQGPQALRQTLGGPIAYATLQACSLISLRSLIASALGRSASKGHKDLAELDKKGALVMAMGNSTGWVSMGSEATAAGPAEEPDGAEERQQAATATNVPLSDVAASGLLGPADQALAAQLAADGLAAGANSSTLWGAERSESKQPPADEAAVRSSGAQRDFSQKSPSALSQNGGLERAPSQAASLGGGVRAASPTSPGPNMTPMRTRADRRRAETEALVRELAAVDAAIAEQDTPSQPRGSPQRPQGGAIAASTPGLVAPLRPSAPKVTQGTMRGSISPPLLNPRPGPPTALASADIVAEHNLVAARFAGYGASGTGSAASQDAHLAAHAPQGPVPGALDATHPDRLAFEREVEALRAMQRDVQERERRLREQERVADLRAQLHLEEAARQQARDQQQQEWLMQQHAAPMHRHFQRAQPQPAYQGQDWSHQDQAWYESPYAGSPEHHLQLQVPPMHMDGLPQPWYPALGEQQQQHHQQQQRQQPQQQQQQQHWRAQQQGQEQLPAAYQGQPPAHGQTVRVEAYQQQQGPQQAWLVQQPGVQGNPQPWAGPHAPPHHSHHTVAPPQGVPAPPPYPIPSSEDWSQDPAEVKRLVELHRQRTKLAEQMRLPPADYRNAGGSGVSKDQWGNRIPQDHGSGAAIRDALAKQQHTDWPSSWDKEGMDSMMLFCDIANQRLDHATTGERKKGNVGAALSAGHDKAAAANYLAPSLLREAAKLKRGGMLEFFRKIHDELTVKGGKNDTAYRSAMHTYCAILDLACANKAEGRSKQDYDIVEITVRRYLAHQQANKAGDWKNAVIIESAMVTARPSSSGVPIQVWNRMEEFKKAATGSAFYDESL